MNSKAIKILGLISAVVMSTAGAFADADTIQELKTSVLSSVVVTKDSSVEEGSINPRTGENTGLNTVFSIQTNDINYKMIMTSSIVSESGNTISGFGNDGRLLFANNDYPPTETAIENAKTGSGHNYNVIAYPVTTNVSEQMSSLFKLSDSTYGACWEIQFADENDGSKGTLTQVIGSTPCSGTYEAGYDAQGEYKATVTLTVVHK